MAEPPSPHVDVNGEDGAEDLDQTGADAERVERLTLGIERRDRRESGHEVPGRNRREENGQRRHRASISASNDDCSDGAREEDCHRDEAHAQRHPLTKMFGSDRSVHACANRACADEAEELDAGETGHDLLCVCSTAVSYRGKKGNPCVTNST